MKISRFVFLTGLIIGLACCSVQHKIIREYRGKTQAELVLAKGKPTSIEVSGGGQTIHIYKRSKFLKAAPINTGQFQYDRFESPKAIKTEIYKFFLNSSGVIENATYEVSYER